MQQLFLLHKVRVADLIGTQSPISSTLQEENGSRLNKHDAAHNLRFQGKKDQVEGDGESTDPENDGVLYCELDSNSSSSSKIEEAEDQSTADSSVQFMSNSKRP